MLASSLMASPQSLPWYLKDFNQSCDDVFCSEGEEDNEEIGDEYTRYSGPLHFEVVPLANEVEKKERGGENDTSILMPSQHPLKEYLKSSLGGKSWCYSMYYVIAIGVIVPCMVLGLRLAIPYKPLRKKKLTSATCKMEFNKKKLQTSKMSASQKRRKRRRQIKGDEHAIPNRVLPSHAVPDAQGTSERDNDSVSALDTTIVSIEQESTKGSTRQAKDDAADIMSNHDQLHLSPSSSMEIVDCSTRPVAVTNSSDVRSAVVWNDTATPCCFNYNEQVQMIAAVVSATGLDDTTSLTLANQTILRRLETQFMLQHQDQEKQKQNQLTDVSILALGVHHFKCCWTLSILVRAFILLHRYLVQNNYPSNALSAIYDFSVKKRQTKMTTSSFIMTFLTHMCGCTRQGETNAVIQADSRQGETYLYNTLSYYYYYTTKVPSIIPNLLQMQCWAFCLIPCLISVVALYLLHRLLDLFHSPKQMHHLINLTAFLTLFSLHDTVLRLTLLHILLILGTNALVYAVQKTFYNRKSQIMIKNSAVSVHVIASLLLGFAID